jgi:lipopolysaccharide/colanic/teichoic acid biosynthesis glycosyltransferase
MASPLSSKSIEPRRFIDQLLSKRMLDLVIAIPALIAAIPIMLAAMTLIRFSAPGPVLFRQVRIGQWGRPFTMLKLRTMYANNDDSTFRDFNTRELLGEPGLSSDGLFKLEHGPRVLPIGRFFRRYSIDELPQLFNVSAVRCPSSVPALLYLGRSSFTAQNNAAAMTAPGLTGLWQVSGRDRLSMRQMLELDAAYVENRSLSLDLWILWRTLPAVLMG